MANLKRRGFLGGMGALFATTPEKVLKASGVSVELSQAGGHIRAGLAPGGTSTGGMEGPGAWPLARKARLIALKTLNPEWFERRRRADARHVSALEPHIASLRSVSASAKINMQREFQYRRYVEIEEEGYDIRAQEEMFSA